MLFALVLLPWLTLPLFMLSPRLPRAAPAWIAGIANVAGLAILLTLAPAALHGDVTIRTVEWIPSLGLELSLRLDGLSFLFALLILAIGSLVVLYAYYYLSAEPRLGRFFACLMLFTAAMLGVVLAENLLLLFVCWELTSLSSFLLVAYWHGKSSAREGARIALAVTGGGGLALLAGIVVLGTVTGSYRLSDVLAAGPMIHAHPHYAAIVVLVLLGAFTKSAQFPFHFWLPGAMAAPTPVSAFLHSATLVKAGVFLLARLYPALSGSDLWFYALVGTGLTTLVFGAYQAMFRHDLKGLLAYSTVSHLGLIVLLLGMGTPLSAVAAVFHVINHATFKASLFMAAGIIDHECGTRDMRRVNGLWRYMPYTGSLAMVAAASMAGVPLVNGFLSKEMFFGEALALERGGALQWLLPVAAISGGVFSVAYSLRFIHDVFFLRRPLHSARTPHEPPRWMRIPVEVLVAVCLIVGLLPALSVDAVLRAAARGVLGAPPPEFTLALWHGVNVPLLMSALALIGGALLYFWMQYKRDLHGRPQSRSRAKRAFDRALMALQRVADGLARAAYGSGVTGGVALLVITALIAGAMPFLVSGSAIANPRATPADVTSTVIVVLACAAAAATALTHRQRLAALVIVSVVGLGMTLLFVWLSAPDLALTQLAVETVTILLLVLALARLPDGRDGISTPRSVRNVLLAAAAGGCVGWLTWAMARLPIESIAGYYLQNSVSQGGGTNAVNVILIDFRGFDTYGEITVIAIAALGLIGLLSGIRNASPRDHDASVVTAARVPAKSQQLMLDLLVRLLLPFALLMSAHLFLRGHNQPGGGFVAGLVAAVALIMLHVGSGARAASVRPRLQPTVVMLLGLIIAGATGVAAMFLDAPFLTSAHGYVDWPLLGRIPLASAMAFDLGVYLVVVGSTLQMLTVIGGAQAKRKRLP